MKSPNLPTVHVPVLLDEVVAAFFEEPPVNTAPIFVDGTLGGGGHTLAMAKELQNRFLAGQLSRPAKMIAFDRDPGAVRRFKEYLSTIEHPAEGFPEITAIPANYADIPEHLSELAIDVVDGILLDVGLSSDQLADQERGFSYQSDGPLDLRFDPMSGEPAWKLLQRLSQRHLADLIYEFGEERHSRKIAAAIVRCRNSGEKPLKTAAQLAELLRKVVPRSRNHAIDPATRTFQALRIAVNDELKWMKVALNRLPDCLDAAGKIAVISFHSLEDRLVKTAFRENEHLTVITKKPTRPTTEEVSTNPRSRSSRLRVAQKKTPARRASE